MQEPGSPLVPLDPTRLQQQMQQPMRETVKRTMSASSVGSVDSSGGGGPQGQHQYVVSNPSSVGGGGTSSGGGPQQLAEAQTQQQQHPTPTMTPQQQQFQQQQQQLSPQFSPMAASAVQQRFWTAQASPHSFNQQSMYGQQMMRAQGQASDLLSLSSPGSVQSSIGSPVQQGHAQTPCSLPQPQQQIQQSPSFQQQLQQQLYQQQQQQQLMYQQSQQMHFQSAANQHQGALQHQSALPQQGVLSQQNVLQQQGALLQQQYVHAEQMQQQHSMTSSFSPNQQQQSARNAQQQSGGGRMMSPQQQQQQAMQMIPGGLASQRMIIAQGGSSYQRYAVQGASPNMQLCHGQQQHQGQVMYMNVPPQQQRMLSPIGISPNSGAQASGPMLASLSPYAAAASGQQIQQQQQQQLNASSQQFSTFSPQQQAQQFSAAQALQQQQPRSQTVLQSPNLGQPVLQQQLTQGSPQVQRSVQNLPVQNVLVSPSGAPQNLLQQQHFQQQRQTYQQIQQQQQLQQQQFQFQQQFSAQGTGSSLKVQLQQQQQQQLQQIQQLQHGSASVMNVATAQPQQQQQQQGPILVSPRTQSSQQSVAYVSNQQQGVSPGAIPTPRVQLVGGGPPQAGSSVGPIVSGFQQILPPQQQQHIVIANNTMRGMVPSQYFHSQQQQPQHHLTLVPTNQIQAAAATMEVVRPPLYFGHDVNVNVPSEMCLLGCVFLIVDYDRILDQKEVSDWRIVIVQHGGEVETSYTNKCTHVVCDSLRHPVVQQALKESKRCVTAQWLNDCVLLKRMQPPWKVVHFPSPYGDNKPCRNRIFSVCGFDVTERTCLKQMVMAVGARYTSYLSRHNTLLVAKCLDGEKVLKAIEWKIPVVNVQWLTELFLGQQVVLQSLNNPKYHQFLTKEAAQHANIELFRIDPSASPFIVLMNAWRNPVTVSVDCWKLASERKQKLEEDCKLFPYKKLRLSPPPDDSDIEKRRKDHSNNNSNSDMPPPRICFTGLYNAEVENLTKKALWLGATVEQEAKDCTHLVVADLKRTRKLLEGLVLGRFIVSTLWIRQSYKQQQFLDCIDYIVKDEGNEKFFGFNVKLSIYRARLKRLFEDMIFYLTPSVQPSAATLLDLIQCAGGSVVQQRPSSNRILDLQQAGVQFVIITCDNDFHLCQHLLELGISVHSAEFVLTGILRQEVDFQSYRIEPKSSDTTSSSKSGRET